MASSLVRPFYRLVANGKEDGFLKATLIITPETVSDVEPGFPLEDWPKRMAAVLAGTADQHLRPSIALEVFAGGGDDKGGKMDRSDITIVGHTGQPPAAWNRINDLWKKSITGAADKKLDDPWGDLTLDIEKSLTGQKHEGDPKNSYQGELGRSGDSIDERAKRLGENGEIVARRPSPAEKIKISGVVANNQSEIAVDEERVRAQRVLRRMLVGPGLPGDDESLLDDRLDDKKGEYSGTAENRKSEFEKVVRARNFDEFKQAIDDTTTSRIASKARFDSIKEIVGKKKDAKLNTQTTNPTTPIAPAARVMTGDGGRTIRAGHVYGGWLQSVEKSKQVSDTKKVEYQAHTAPKTTVAETAKATEAATAFERVRSVYYSFQGDALQSRLFCLAAEVRIKLPEAMAAASPDKPVYVYLVAEECEEKRKTTQTLTGAKFDGIQFWPVSRFDIPNTEPDAATLVEQRDGVWLLGEGYGGKNPVPRYHLTSVDFRRSVDSTTDAVDRGQRHNTAGVTILDRDRAGQIARDLAISSVQLQTVCDQAAHQCDVAKRHCVVLWAEELTIGRRLDIAVVKDNAKVSELNWRSLMYRKVALDLEGAVTKILAGLVGKLPADHFHEETSFQVATRSMPLLGVAGSDTERQVEAIADETVVTWDGTPLAAMVRHDTDEDAPHKGPKLPFTRTLSLEVDGANRPPPLRYGVGYAFSMRSVFIGGGSAPVTIHKTSDGSALLPPAVNKSGLASRKRFLRHESISAPPVLLPAHLAEEKKVGVMGYETSDRVVLRTDTSTVMPKNPPDRYITPKERATPARSMRIFVAPTVALDTAIRHRKLDSHGTAVMHGGLQHVLFDPEKDGFPIAVTEQAPEFNGEKADTRRYITQNNTSTPAEKKKKGAAVFVAGGTNATKPGKIGYLPDPAADNMVVRLRIRGSDRYLSGFWVTPLYDKAKNIVYPHALPLVVTIEKLAAARPRPVHSFSEVFSGDPKAVKKLAPNGTIGASGVDVRHLIVNLAPGEDFDLEVVCLPDAKKLAHTFALPETIALQVDHSAKDACGADDLVCLCGPGSEARLANLRERLSAANKHAGTEIALGGRTAPDLTAIEAIAGELINTIQSNWQIEELAAVQSVRVTHAINVPLQGPGLSLTGAKRPLVYERSSLEAILIAPSEPGAVVALLQGKVALDLEQTGAFELVIRTAATGGKPLDDKSRARSLLARRSGRWPQLVTKGGEPRFVSTQDVLGFEVGNDGRIKFPTDNITVFRAENLPDPRALPTTGTGLDFARQNGRRTEIDLALVHAAAIAKQSIEIPVATDAPCPTGSMHKIVVSSRSKLDDTRARKVYVSAVAISRFSPLFETASLYPPPDDLLKRRQQLVPEHQSVASEEKELWIPSTKRPARCDVRAPAPAFVFERTATKLAQGARQCVTRTARTRLHFGRGMFDSGEGERIGIVLWPPDYAAQDPAQMEQHRIVVNGRKLKFDELDDADLGLGGAFVTRWGGDPIRKDMSTQRSIFIPAGAFRDLERLGTGPHRPGYVARARMPIDVSEEIDPATGKIIVKDAAPPVFLEVSLLTYEPCFDLDREEWYVDVDLHPARATDPFVRFGLVRYQEHSINEDLMVSEPVVAWTQILPARNVTLTHAQANDHIKLEAIIVGQASDGIKPPISGLSRPPTADETKTLSLLKRPIMQMTVMHEGFTANGILTRTPIRVDGLVENSGEPSDGLMHWELSPDPIPLSRVNELGKGTLVAYIEEIEKRMPATYASEPIIVGDMLAEKTIVASGPRFSARIVFHES